LPTIRPFNEALHRFPQESQENHNSSTAFSHSQGQKHRSAITRQSTALTSGNDLRIMRTRGRRAIYCEPMASNIKLEDSIVLRPSIL
jgi:hypothetical protein